MASGSKGNVLYLGTNRTKILIDAGLSAKAIREKLAEIHVDISEIEAVLVTHEHGDHIRGISTLAGKYGIPVFANSDTAKAICSQLETRPKFKIFSTGETFVYKDLEIHPFSVQHDTLDPVAFTVQIGAVKMGICTDLGFVTTLVQSHLQRCDYVFIEANHEPSLVHGCARPMVYKKRVLGRQGHLSNEACAVLIKEIMHPNLKKIYLAHLSSECNRPNLAIKTVRQHLKDTGREVPISLALQDSVSEAIFFEDVVQNSGYTEPHK